MSELSKQALVVDNNQSFPNNNNGAITPSILRAFNTNMIDSTVNQTQYTSDSASFNTRINAATGSGGITNTGSFATTGSNTFVGNQNISGSIFFPNGAEIRGNAGQQTVIASNTNLSLEGATSMGLTATNNLSLSGSSLFIQNLRYPNFDGAAGQVITTDGAGILSFTTVSGSGTTINTGSFATTGSNTFTGNQTINGNLTIFNPITTGSFRFENYNNFDSNGIMYGPVVTYISSSNTLRLESDFVILAAKNGSVVLSGSAGTTIQGVDFIPFSSSLNTRILAITGSGGTIDTGSFATTGSNTFTGTQTIQNPSGFSNLNVYADVQNNVVYSAPNSFFSATGNFSFNNAGNAGGSGSLSFTATSQSINLASDSGIVIGRTVFGGPASSGATVLINHSGSLVLSNQTVNPTTLGHISSSQATSNTNLIFKTNNNIGDTVVSGSANIFTNFSNPATGFKRYVGGNNNIINNTVGFQLTGSATYSPITQNNILNGVGGQVFFRTATSLVGAVGHNVANNFINSQLALGINAANHFERAISGSTTITNILNGGLALIANKTNLTNAPVVSNSLIGGGNVTVNMNSSSVSLANMQSQGTLTVTNDFSSSLSASTNFAQIIGGFTNLGNANLVYFSGSNSGTNPVIVTGGSMIGNLNGLNSSLGGDNAYLTATSLIGHGLALTGSSTYAIPTANNNTAGTLVTGRFNQQGMLSGPTVFAVGTGTSSARKTGFLIDSGSNTFIEGTLNVSGATSLNGDLIITGSLTASLQEGFVYVGNASGITTTVATSSFIDNQVTSASFNSYTSSTDARLTNIETTTASLLIETSNLEAFTSSQSLLNTTFATTASNSFTGSQIITGSLIVTGSAYGNVVALSITSNTASMDLNLGNYFTLTLTDLTTTHISASNVQPGQSATLVITTGTNSSASLSPTMLQPSGSAYSATLGSAKKDVLSIVSVATGVPFVVSTKNMV